ncbi:MAG: hypothetical protein EXR72_19445 [Myxococcales bacterium]|nr:hypothetical protein [Myxococcales bacterium]
MTRPSLSLIDPPQAAPKRPLGLRGLFLLATALLLTATAAAAPPLAPAPRWEIVISLDLVRGLADVAMTLEGFPAPLLLCEGMDGSARTLRDLRRTDGEKVALLPDKEREECFRVAPPTRSVALRYTQDLARLADDHGDPDWASRFGEDWIFNDQAVLLGPDPLPADTSITVEFRLPGKPGTIDVAVPWTRLPGPGYRFRHDPRQVEAGTYVAVGHLALLGELPVRGGTVSVITLGGARRATAMQLKDWVARAIAPVADFYGTLPGGRVQVLLAPVAGSAEPGVFGTVLRRATPSLVLFFGAEAAAFDDDWMAIHEMFHLGNPPLEHRLPWLVEGFATYYQEVLRGRAGRPAERAWGDLAYGFTRFCSPDRGVSLGEESRRLRQTQHYQRVYWGGACLAFQADVAIRERTANRTSLDDLLRGFRTSPRDLNEGEIVAAIDRAVGRPLVKRHLAAGTPPVDLVALYRRLGIEPQNRDLVRLRDDAPLAAVRRAILAR